MPKLLADYFYLWETTVVQQAIETARNFCLVRRTFVELLVPVASTCGRRTVVEPSNFISTQWPPPFSWRLYRWRIRSQY
jgi:hypothetical protein